MTASTARDLTTVALIGNPNTGKSTLFGALVGVRQRVGNYPGVTVERRSGHMEYAGRKIEMIDLPGLYSLAPRSRDEMVAVDVLLGRVDGDSSVDLVVCVLDASNLSRNLYLVSQVLQLGLPVVVAVNMLDVAESRGVKVDCRELENRLGVPVIPTQAVRHQGISDLKAAIHRTADAPRRLLASPMPRAFQDEVESLHAWFLAERGGADHRPLDPYLVERLILDANGYLAGLLFPGPDPQVGQRLEQSRGRLEAAGCRIPGVETDARYAWIQEVLRGVVSEPEGYAVTWTDRIDGVLTHRVWGTALFAVLMMILFQAVFAGAVPFMELIDSAFGALGSWLEARMVAGALRSLLVDGVVAGVGGVMVFLPQILVLFFFIGILEDCGYMARAAYLMDKFMSRVGLSGKSFIPMISSFACAIPGIMATRVIEDERDRLTTILVAPLMTCSARLPVYALLIAAFVPARPVLGIIGLRGLTLFALYFLGIATAVLVALLLKRTLLRGETPPFVIELPSYKRPSLRTVLHRVWERGWLFLRCAGTMILAVSIVVWAALYYPHDASSVDSQPHLVQLTNELALADPAGPDYSALRARYEHERSGEFQRQSYLGRAGRVIEPIFRPLGWDWRISCAVLASFPAREIVVATLGVIFNLGEEVDAESQEGATAFGKELHAATWDGSGRKLFTLPVALSLLVFFALCAQCAATLAVIRRETNSWRWPLFTFGYMTALAYLGALVTYQLGTWIAG
ncbi:MAG: ferrous iron transport protein B [Thermoguttaceae bacterium]